MLLHVLLAALAGLALGCEHPPPPSCGPGAPSCPGDSVCRPASAACTDTTACAGVCAFNNEYPACGSARAASPACAPGTQCVDDPRLPAGCGLACGVPGICVPAEPRACGGFAGFLCPRGMYCYDDPGDECHPDRGGADCIGLCL